LEERGGALKAGEGQWLLWAVAEQSTDEMSRRLIGGQSKADWGAKGGGCCLSGGVASIGNSVKNILKRKAGKGGGGGGARGGWQERGT